MMSFEVCLVCVSKSLQLVKLVRTFSDVFKHSLKISGILYAFLFELQFVICSRSFAFLLFWVRWQSVVVKYSIRDARSAFFLFCVSFFSSRHCVVCTWVEHLIVLIWSMEFGSYSNRVLFLRYSKWICYLDSSKSG